MLKIEYLNKNIKNTLLGSTLFLAVVVSWYLLTRFKIVPIWLLPSPVTTFREFWLLFAEKKVFALLVSSFTNILPAFALAGLVSIVLGVIVGRSRTCQKIFLPFLASFILIPSLAWLPLIILFLGISKMTIWTLVFISSFIRIIYNVISGVRGIDQSWVLTAQSIGLNRYKIITKVILPGAFPQILSGVRIGFGSAWRSLIGAEMLVLSAGGLGKYIWMAQWAYDFEKVFSGIILIAFVGVLVEIGIFRTIEKNTLLRWGMIE